MPVPLLVLWIAAAVTAGAITMAAALAINKWLKLRRTVAFIGRSGSGKTTLAHFLEHGSLPQADTAPSTDQSSRKGSTDGLTIIVVDSAGDRLAQWEDAVGSASGVVYFFDASLVAKGDREALSALAADAEHIRDLLSRGPLGGDRNFTLLGTHDDLFQSKADEQRVRKSKEVQSLRNACDLGDDDVVIGSLADERSAGRVAAKVARRQTRGKK